jgi:septum site-determining protein MinD
MKKIIVISSGKCGVGKTTTAVNLGAAINYFGEDVLVIDGNLSTPNIGIHLGSPDVPISLNDIISGDSPAEDAVYEHESGMKVLPASISIKDSQKIDFSDLKNYKKDFKGLADYIIVDGAAGLGDEAMSAVALADEIIIVTNPEMPAITDALKLIKLAEQMKKPIKGIIVTRVKRNSIELSPDTVRDMLEAPILGMIPEDQHVQESIAMKDAVVHTHPKSNASRAYKEIASKIIDKDYDSKKDKEGFFEKVAKAFGWGKGFR